MRWKPLTQGGKALCVLAGGPFLVFGLLSGYNSVSWDGAVVEMAAASVMGGLGLGLILLAFLPRD